jgi:plasmid stabilization system protein ParE
MFGQKLRQLTKTLSEFPGAGARTLAPGDVRRFVLPPYVIEYEVHPNELVILRIYHGRQDQIPADRQRHAIFQTDSIRQNLLQNRV